jgi:hypothetical protein
MFFGPNTAIPNFGGPQTASLQIGTGNPFTRTFPSLPVNQGIHCPSHYNAVKCLCIVGLGVLTEADMKGSALRDMSCSLVSQLRFRKNIQLPSSWLLPAFCWFLVWITL